MEGENMLVLTRKTGEGISIGDGIKIRVVEIKGGQVRLGIDAPSEFRILREEIRDKVQMEINQGVSQLYDTARQKHQIR
jgi:carbon storage regulator CsrA